MTVDAPKINVVFRANLGPSIMRRRSVVKFVLRPLFFRWIGRKEGRERKKEVSLSFVLSTDVSPIILEIDRKGALSAFCRKLGLKKLQKGFRQFRQKHRKNRKGQFLQKGAISAERASFCKINIYRKRPFLQKISAFG